MDNYGIIQQTHQNAVPLSFLTDSAFGGHPTLQRMVEWLSEQGCEARVSVRTTERGRSYQILEIINPKGGRYIMAEPDFEERLVPSIVSQIQRRLCIATPFASMPEAGGGGDSVPGAEESKS